MRYLTIISAILGLLLCGCRHYPARKVKGLQKVQPPLAASPKELPGHRMTELERHTHWRLDALRFEKRRKKARFEDLEPISFRLYRPLTEEKAPLVLVLPIFKGNYFFSNHFSKALCKEGFVVILPNRQERLFDISMEQINEMLAQHLEDLKQIVDWAEKQPYIDADRIGVLGISMGGVKAAMLQASDRRIKTSVLCLSGGNLAEIISKSNEKTVIRYRDAQMQKYALDLKAFRNKLAEEIKLDPLHLASYISAEHTLLILARFDRTVPYKNGLALLKAIGGPEHIVVPATHLSAILWLPYIRHKSVDYLKRKLMP